MRLSGRIRALISQAQGSPPSRVGNRGTLIVTVRAATLRAEAVHGGVVTWVGEAAYASCDELGDAIARLAAEPTRPCRRLEVAIERPVVQLRTLVGLPPVKQRALAALVAHQPGRFFRKNGKPLVTDAVWVANGAVAVARAVAVEEPLLEAIVAGARAAGLRLDGISPAEGPSALLLLPAGEREGRARTTRTWLRRLAIAALGAWLCAGALVVGRLGWERRRVAAELATLQEPLAAVLSARRELREVEAILRTVGSAEGQRGTVTALLGTIARVLPDSAVVTSFSWDGEVAVLTGVARRAGEVLARLERARVLPIPRFEGPIVREAMAGREWERFTIVFGDRGSGIGDRDGHER